MLILKAAYNESNKSYNFNEFFSTVKDYISNADLSICNSETCYLDDGSPYCGYHTLNSPNDVLDSLKYSGYDVLASAHNHILDTGTKGFNSTSKAITEKGFDL